MIRQFIKDHKIFIIIVIAIIALFYLINTFISKNTIILGGEYIFSFDYLGHVSNILHDPRSLLATDNTNCFDCPDFYHYSRWYSLFKIGYHAISQIIFLHPFLFLLQSMILTQLISLYIFTRAFFKKFSIFAFLIAAFTFIFYPYKFSLLIETHDGLLYSNMILYLTALVWFYKNIARLSIKQNLLIAICAGILLALFFNVNIAFLPIALYMSLIVSMIYWRKLWSNKKRFLQFIFFLILIPLLINIPLFQSLLQNGNSRHYEGYLSFNFIDSFLGGLNIAQANPWIISIYSFVFLLTIPLAKIKLRNKKYLLVGYVLIALMIMGNNAFFNIYGWIFEHVPLFDSLRSTYRFMFFEFFIIYIFVYFTLIQFPKKDNYKKLFFWGITICLIALPIWHISLHTDYFYSAKLPQEYFDTQEYVNNLPDAKIYFPPSVPLLHNIATDYTWSGKTYTQTILLYKNPFTSLVPIRNLIQFERFPYLLSPKYLEIYYLTNLDMKAEDIIKALELRNVRYIIVDENYQWKTIYPNFDLNRFIALTKTNKKFGNILILEIPNKSSLCKKGYGTIQLDYCTSVEKNVALFNKTKEEFILETQPELIGEALNLRRNTVYTKSILDPLIHKTLVENKILFSKDIMQITGDQQNVFHSKKLKAGGYIFYASIYKESSNRKLMGDAEIELAAKDNKLGIIRPYNPKPGMYWDKIYFELSDEEIVNVNIKNKGYIIFNATPILRRIN